MKKASFIFSPRIGATELGLSVKSLLSQDGCELEIIHARGSESLDRASAANANPAVIVPVIFDPAMSLPHWLNGAVTRSSGDVLFFVADAVVFSQKFTRVWLDRLSERPGTALAYGCFEEALSGREARLREVRTDCYDFSEGSQIGPVRGVHRAAFDAAGGYDESLQYAFEYDLRLRLLEKGHPARIEQALYTVVPASTEKTGSLVDEHFRCYVRPDEAGRARSYLDYGDEEEQEFRDTCFRALRRHGALLTAPPERFNCRHAGPGHPSVTVVIPLWNREETIGPALQSVIQSNVPFDFEVLVVDNGSTDTGPDIVAHFAEHAPVRLLRNPENNIAGALNTAIRASNAKYICQLDSDDLYTPETLETLVSYMEAHPRAALGVSYYDCIGPDGAPIADRDVVRHLEYCPNNLMRTDGVGHARIWHRCVLEDLGGFDEQRLGNYAEDYDLQLKLCERYEILRIPHVLYHYRMNHKKPGETMDYEGRHEKKTLARRLAIERRKRKNSTRRRLQND